MLSSRSRRQLNRDGNFENVLTPFEVPVSKVYIAASLNDHAQALKMTIALERSSNYAIKVTSRWLLANFHGEKTKFNTPMMPATFDMFYSMQDTDITDIDNADTVVLLVDEDSTSGGREVELGYALGNRKNILIVGTKLPNIFYLNERINRALTIDKAVDWLVSQTQEALDALDVMKKTPPTFIAATTTPVGKGDEEEFSF